MNLNKHFEFFNPDQVTDEIHIIGVGAIGSTIAEMLVRLGITNIHIYDFDKVTDHNITNQIYTTPQIGMSKVEALSKILLAINPELKLETHPEGWNEYSRLQGYVFLAVDSIELRKQIVQTLKYNNNIHYVTDCRMRLTDAQCYTADWSDDLEKTKLFNSMNFSSEEAKAATPVSACGTTLSVTPTVRMIVSVCCSNFINFVLQKVHKTIILIDAFSMNITAFPE